MLVPVPRRRSVQRSSEPKKNVLSLTTGPPKVPPELVLDPVRRSGEHLFFQVAPRVQVVIVMNPEGSAVRLVAAALGDNTDHAFPSRSVSRGDLS